MQPIKNKTVIRCSKVRAKKSGEERVCSRFLAEISVTRIIIRCPDCGAEYLVTGGEKGLFVQQLPDHSVLKTD